MAQPQNPTVWIGGGNTAEALRVGPVYVCIVGQASGLKYLKYV